MKHEDVVDTDLCIAFVTDRKIKALNKQFLHRAYMTDVLAFDLSDSNAPFLKKVGQSKKVRKVKGDVIISTTTAFRNSEIYHTLPEDEIILYIIHGILHLLGYDDHSLKDIKRMRKKEQLIMKHLKDNI